MIKAALPCSITLLAASVMGGGCEQLPSGNVGDPVATEVAMASIEIVPSAWSRLGFVTDWRSQAFMAEGGALEDVAVYDDLVVVRDGDNILSVMDAATGKRRDPLPVASPRIEYRGLVREGNTVWVCGGSEALGVDLTSVQLVDRQAYSDIVGTPPLNLAGTLVFGSTTGEVRTHSITQRVPRWSNATVGSIMMPPVGVDYEGTVTAVGVVSDSGEVLFIDPYDGRAMSRSKIFSGTDVPLATGAGLMFIASRDQSLYAFRPGQERHEWRVRCTEPLRGRPVFRDGVVYCDLPGRGFSSVNAADGVVKNSNEDLRGEVVGETSVGLVVWDGSTISLVDRERLDVLEYVEISGVDRVVMHDTDLYLIGDAGLIVKMRKR